MAIKICLDAGHGKNFNTGAVSGFYEGNNNYYSCLALKAELEKYEEVNVVLTRTALTDDPSYEARCKLGQDADLFFSWHSNGWTEESTCGVVSFYSIYRPDDKILCDKLNKEIVALFGGKTYDRGAQTLTYPNDNKRDYYAVIRQSVLTNGNSFGATPIQSKCKHSIIVEHGFHSNKAECEKLADPAFREKLIKAEARIIAEYFGLKKIPAAETKGISEGDIVSVSPDAVYYNGVDVPDFVVARKWIVKSVSDDRAVIDKSVDGEFSINSPVNVKYLTVEEKEFEPYTVKLVTPIHKSASADSPVVGTIDNGGVYTIVEENGGWGKLKSGAGWISLDYVEKV